MTALTSSIERGATPFEWTLAEGTTVYKGGAAGVAPDTRTVRALQAGDRFAGFVRNTVVSNARPLGRQNVLKPQDLITSGLIDLDVSGVVAGSFRAPVFATDDNTFSLTPGGSFIGFVAAYLADGRATVAFDVNGSNVVATSQGLVSPDGILLVMAPPSSGGDDGARLQEFATAAGAGAVLQLMQGQIYTCRNLRLATGQTLQLNGATLQFGGAHGTAPVSENVHTVVYAEGTSGARLSNIAVVGPGKIIGSRTGDDYTSTGAGEQDTLSFQYVDGVQVRGVVFEDTKQDCISLDQVTAVVIAGNRFLRSGDVAVDVRVGSGIIVSSNYAETVRSLVSCKPNNTGVLIEGNTAETFGVGITAHGAGWRISNNRILATTTPDGQDGATSSGIEVYETGGAQTGVSWAGMTIMANVILGRSSANGIYLRNSPNSTWTDVAISGNVIDAHRGVLVESGTRVAVTGNSINSGVSGGVVSNNAQVARLTITGNAIQAVGTSGAGIIDTVTPGVVISDNTLQTATAGVIGIRTTSAAIRAKIVGNEVRTGTGVAILANGAGSVINGNECVTTAAAAINVAGASSTVTGNALAPVGGEGVLISAARATVSGNTVVSGTHGVRVGPSGSGSAASNSVVTGNTITGCSFFGVNVTSGCVDAIVTSNNLVGNTSGGLTDAGTTTTAANNKP